MTKQDHTSLTDAATALEAELDRFGALAASLRKMPLTSQKNVERAARSLQEAVGYEERLGARLRGLLDALNAASQRQQESAASIVERGREIEARGAEYGEVLTSYAALGAEAQELVAITQEIAAGTSSERLDELVARMGGLVERGQEIARMAAEKEMTDVARAADALKQQIAGARNKVLLLQRRGEGGDARRE
jgi:hypothetical protein